MSKEESLKYIQSKVWHVRFGSAFVILAVGTYSYLNRANFDPWLVLWTAAGLFTLWGFVIVRRKYLQVMLARTVTRLERKTLSSEEDVKEVMSLLGTELCTALKAKFERDLQTQWQKDSLKDCDLYSCAKEKKSHK